jgi:hypothetical protein
MTRVAITGGRGVIDASARVLAQTISTAHGGSCPTRLSPRP